jgi:hypothetical protein
MVLKLGLPKLRGQGSTEYLVLLAVVLIIALVSLALLSFFPGTSLDAKLTQSKMYWSSASPIAIVDWEARTYLDYYTRPYLRIKNTGVYPIRITGIIGGDGGKATQFEVVNFQPSCNPSYGINNISDYYYLAPGEERYFGVTYYLLGSSNLSGVPCDYRIRFVDSSSGGPWGIDVGGARSLCQYSATNPGIVEFKTFGFEYIEYVEGKEIVKKQIGSVPLMFKCLPAYPYT